MSYRKDRFQINLAVYLILEKEGRVLLMRRFNTGYQDGNYGLPSGHVDEGELPSETIIREAEEEIGVKLKKCSFSNTVYNTKGGFGCYICLFFNAEEWTGEIKNREPEKCDDMKWFPRNQLPTNIAPEVKLGIENYLSKKYYSEL